MLLKLLLVVGAIALLVWSERARRAKRGPLAARPKDYRVNEAMLATRFAHLAEGPQGLAFRAFLAKRGPEDELHCVHEPEAGGFAAWLTIRRKASEIARFRLPEG